MCLLWSWSNAPMLPEPRALEACDRVQSSILASGPVRNLLCHMKVTASSVLAHRHDLLHSSRPSGALRCRVAVQSVAPMALYSSHGLL